MVFARVASRAAAQSLRASPLTSGAAPLNNAFRQAGGVRTLTASASRQGKVLLVLYDVSTSFLKLD